MNESNMSFNESSMEVRLGEENNLETAREFFMDDGMEPLPDDIEVASIEDIINQTGLSPEILAQYRIDQSAQ
jgi:predicted house-cleaning noncanonical NTP pyrophosphatase (MazG superfamily)